MWKTLRIALLLFILIGVAGHEWLDRRATSSWRTALWVGVYPINGDGSASTQDYIAGLQTSDFTPIEAFFDREAQRFGLTLEHPLHLELYPASRKQPPELAPGAGIPAILWWSLKLRWFAHQAMGVPGRPDPRVRLFVLYHDPATLRTVPDSHGLQKGLVGVVHAYATRAMAGRNNIVITHELMHTLGASDKYDPVTGAPQVPSGLADPDRRPLYPQEHAEIMAGRLALSVSEFEMPPGLQDVVVGPATAAEIHWPGH